MTRQGVLTRAHLTAWATLLLVWGCDRKVPDGPGSPLWPKTPAAGEVVAQPPSAASPEGPTAIRPMKKVPILVGGCGGDCSEPGMAVAGFLQATLEDLERVERFVDTTDLVVDGRAVGAEWVQMWKEMRTATRKVAIREVVKDLASWTNGLTESQVRSILASGVRPVRVWSTEAEYHLALPGGAWRLTLRPRGLEWLIMRVKRGPGTDGEP